VLRVVRRRKIPGNFSGSGVEALAVPGLHAVGLLLRMFALLNQCGTQINNTQTSPPDQKAPRIVSRLHTLENESKICRQAFLPGKHFTVPSLPNVTAVNALGDFSIARDRLAIIDGEGSFVYPYLRASHFLPIPLRTVSSPMPISPAYVRTTTPLRHCLPPLRPLSLHLYAPIPPMIQSSELLTLLFIYALPGPLSEFFATHLS